MSRPIVIGVAGGSASGKTTVVGEIVRALGTDRVTVIQHDSYYLDRSTIPLADRARINYDHPDALETDLLVRHLRELRAGRPIAVPVYDYSTHTRSARTQPVPPRKVVILEGILILADPALRALMDIRVYVDADADVRLIRRLERDIHERGRSLESVVRQYLETVQPMHLEFVEPSKRHAHVIIPEGGRNQVAVDMLLARIEAVLRGEGLRREGSGDGK
ncbi:MAG: uridine kinase [Verrucomicrobiota bacterium]